MVCSIGVRVNVLILVFDIVILFVKFFFFLKLYLIVIKDDV